MSPSPQHRAVKYAKARLPDVAAASIPQAEVAGGVEYTVTCSQCNGAFKVVDYQGQYLSGTGSRKKAAATRPLGVVCECGLDHKRRPADAAGCGAVWDIVR